jgi:hypothetical protein
MWNISEIHTFHAILSLPPCPHINTESQGNEKQPFHLSARMPHILDLKIMLEDVKAQSERLLVQE